MPEATTSSTVLAARNRADPSFLGRTQELELVHQLLIGGTARRLTLTGPAGVGKTRLAQEAGKRFGDAFPDGVRFVDLTPIRDPAEVPSAIAESLGFPDTSRAPLLERLSACLHARQTLLILDNFEQVLSAGGDLQVPVTAQDHIQGPDTAPVTLVEYADYDCPYSGRAYHVIKGLQRELGDQLRFVYRNFPLREIHPMRNTRRKRPRLRRLRANSGRCTTPSSSISGP